MFCRNVLSVAEFTNSCKPSRFQQIYNSTGNLRLFRKSFHKAQRGGRRPALEPDPLESVHVETGPLSTKKLFKPFFFTIGVSTASLTGCVIWEYENLRAHASSLLKRPSNWLSSQQKKVFAQFKKEPGPLRKWWNSLKDNNNNNNMLYCTQ